MYDGSVLSAFSVPEFTAWLTDGRQLARLPGIPETIYDMMQRRWRLDPTERVTVEGLASETDKLVCNRSTLEQYFADETTKVVSNAAIDGKSSPHERKKEQFQ
ncbi:hypothetical protein BV898_05297 [Hypsibius exemplaris]|uniref:Serine-threonine/tyrosine-protein kinase catalytic domain-containing protein n=1 Tax=Hypsibius exemplaris TaxID=2072580 RepID=A0A1W0WZR9_HYPEX|nr:hypothetical protein BV898_05297 [Hypsibius exemplaris]